MLIKHITDASYIRPMLELINWLKDGKYRRRVLEVLEEGPQLSSEIANKLGINRASMSRILKGLKEKNLLESVQSKSRTVTYVLNDEGKQTLELLREFK